MAEYASDKVDSLDDKLTCSDKSDVIIKHLPRSFMDLIATIAEHDKQIKKLTTHQDKVFADKTFSIDLKQSDLIKEVEDLRDRVNTLTRKVIVLKEKQRRGPGTVAFFATMSDHSNPSHGERLVFDTVITNNGDAYNRYNGTFVAPIAGLYVFSATVMPRGAEIGVFRLIRNMGLICNIYPDAAGIPFTLDMASCSSVIHLDKHDDVAVDKGSTKGAFMENTIPIFLAFY
ncbi:hypothetical protein DPMN_057238 [Dreissena polymorpha]|uniref:C1q domain-containing protein n=1 Tax=Dreissena polymorpha TaxID=45954 RepID=A0A9D4HUC2_DREPO|nr:hypothetical protein DPMN_057238 [Dreissena polymorpha]